MNEGGRRSGCGKCRGDLARNMARFAHPADDQLPVAGVDRIAGVNEILVERAFEQFQRLALDADDFTAAEQDCFTLESIINERKACQFCLYCCGSTAVFTPMTEKVIDDTMFMN